VANCYAALGQVEEAEKFILAQVKRGFDDPQFYHVLGSLYALRGNYDKALPYFEECLKKIRIQLRLIMPWPLSV